jgi:hypothetical protein
MGIVRMSTEKKDVESVKVQEERVGSGSEALPPPPMLWLLVPVALLALLAFLSQR